MMIHLRGLVCAGLLTLLPVATPAATFGETVMAPKLLSNLPQGTSLQWLLQRELPLPPTDAPPPKGGWRRLTAEGGKTFTLTATPQGTLVLYDQTQQLAEFPASSPHPMLLMFLENVMRSLSQETGGNPHYIRNRMRTALGQAQVEDGLLRITPFVSDPNQNRFGDFANLRIEVTWSPQNPSDLLALKAYLPENPNRYSETLTLIKEGE